MAVRLGEDGGFDWGNVSQRLFGQRSAQLGDVVQVKKGQSLEAPPQGRLWHSPWWANGLFELHDLVRRPVFELGDVFGIHPTDPIPLPPSGTTLQRLDNPKTSGTPARVYKIVAPEMAAVVALPKPRPPALEAHAGLPQPEPGRRWQVAYVDGRDLRKVMGAMVPA